MRVQRANPRLEYTELAALFFIQWMGLATWMVPLTLILNAHGLHSIQPFAFATSAIAAFVSPLFFGAVADRRAGPTRVLRWLACGTAVTMALVSTAIECSWNRWLILGLIQCFSLCASPTTSVANAIVLSRLDDPRRQFGPVRAMGTIGWMAGCWLISALDADASTRAGFTGTILWIGLAAFTFILPDVEPPKTVQHLTIRQRLGLDALSLLKQSDNRTVFLTAALFTIPLAAFYPYTTPQLRDLGFEHASAWMSLGQTTEIVAMFSLGMLITRFRLKWILGAGLGFGLLRYILCGLNRPLWLLAGIALHGCTYTLFFTTAQIYVNERVDAAWRARAQALLTLMVGGAGNLIGYLGCGWWFNECIGPEARQWPLFWGGLAGIIALVAVYFLAVYRGRVLGCVKTADGLR